MAMVYLPNGPVALLATSLAPTLATDGGINALPVSIIISKSQIHLQKMINDQLPFYYSGHDAYCGDDCPTCTGLSVTDLCSNADAYGGCTGWAQSYMEVYCKGTCGLC